MGQIVGGLREGFNWLPFSKDSQRVEGEEAGGGELLGGW